MKVLIVKGVEFQLDDEDYERLKGINYHIYKANGKDNGKVYARRGMNTKVGKIIIPLTWDVLNIIPPIGLTVDHIDRNPKNNLKSNLRLASKEQQVWNRKRSSLSGFKGVTRHRLYKTKKPWCAKITVRHKTIYLGHFFTPEEAAMAYNEAAKKYFGEFAVLNP